MFRILIAEDDNEIRELFATVLRENGFLPVEAPDGAKALEILEKQHIDLVISDIMMPRMDGYELTRMIRSMDPILPILMITAKDSIFYKKEGFLSGTDDYMVKPVDVNEMIWRIRALLRRSRSVSDRRYVLGSTCFLADSNQVTTKDKEYTLPPKEFQLLYKLAGSPNRTFTRIQLMDEIWGYDSETTLHTLEVHIGRLREKFRDNPDFEILTVRGLGYKVVTTS